jgi:hypothetical protein
MVKKCEFCDSDMEIKIVQKKNAKNYGEIISKHKNKRFCSLSCQINWQKNTKWEDRVGEKTAEKIRKETSLRVSGENNPSCDPIVAEKISNSLKKYLKEHKRIKEKNPFFGKQHSEEYKKWASESRLGKVSYSDEQYKKKVENQPRGENCHLWKGGVSFEPYNESFNNKLKKKIKNRDNYTCYCGKQSQKLAVHHIDYDKQNSDERNLISLCYTCHSKTNFNREKWKIFFESLIQEKYDKISDFYNGTIVD